MKEGKALEAAGKYKQALKVWESARTGFPDPRIGIAYLELATAKNLKGHYAKASEMYYWGMSGDCDTDEEEAIKKEMYRLKPITSRRRFEKWEKYLKKDPARICSEFVKFWKLMDPTIATSYNERLLEHWQRIAYSRKHFDRNRSTVYDADERARVYVKLGKPDYTRSGSMGFDKSLVREWIAEIMDFQLQGSGGTGTDSSASGGGAMSTSGRNISQIAGSMLKSREIDQYAREAELLHRLQYYEVWVYYNKLPGDENLVYIFGQDGDTGEFEELGSLEDMIPTRAFKGRSSSRKLTPGLLLQLMFYRQLIHVDNYFADAFSDLESNLLVASGLHRLTSFGAKSRNVHELTHIQVQAPREESTILKEIPTIELQTYQYRFLDADNQPFLATYVIGKPQKALFLDLAKNRSLKTDSYHLNFYVRTSDENNNIIDTKSKRAQIHAKGKGNVEQMPSSYVYFEIPQDTLNELQSFTAELHNAGRDTTEIQSNVFPGRTRALGRVDNRQAEPLKTDPEELEMSDVIMGVSDDSANYGKDGLAGFKVVHDNTIEENKNLRIYFEIYHLKSQKPDPNTFMLKYKVVHRSKNFFKRLFGSKEKVGLTLNYETVDSYYHNNLEIVTSSFEPGRYRLHLEVVEPVTGRKTERDVPFIIKESDR